MDDTLETVLELLKVTKELPATLRERIVGFGPAAAGHLLALVENRALWNQDAPGGGWTPVHAIELLGELRAAEGIPLLLEVLGETDLDHVLHDRALAALRRMGPAVVEPALALHASSRHQDLRDELCFILAGSGAHDRRILTLLYKLLERSPATGALTLGEYGDPEALEPLHRAFARVDARLPSEQQRRFYDELRDAIEALGGELTPAERGLYDLAPVLARREAQTQTPARAAQHPGRNEPCWCGSGKKYKHCHLDLD